MGLNIIENTYDGTPWYCIETSGEAYPSTNDFIHAILGLNIPQGANVIFDFSASGLNDETIRSFDLVLTNVANQVGFQYNVVVGRGFPIKKKYFFHVIGKAAKF